MKLKHIQIRIIIKLKMNMYKKLMKINYLRKIMNYIRNVNRNLQKKKDNIYKTKQFQNKFNLVRI